MTQANQAGTGLPLTHEHWQRQALLCQWLATLMSKELDDATLQAYQAGDAAPLLDWLAEDGLSDEADALRSAIAGLALFEHPRLELAADFATLFLSDARHSAAPYASCYLTERGGFMAEPAQRMAQRLANAGVTLPDDFKEPADHLAVMLDYLAGGYRQLAELSGPAQATALAGLTQFLREELCNWLPAFSHRCQRQPTASPFYPGLARLVVGFCQQRLTEASAE
ncbi:molecular chaperone TorD [Oceanimonas sp. CHS3-5]|uniref:molecular chaperone TorD n=1 Tax=Oceanimonas sp. CHS3-5 TaxID=3068186 RepID=UPI00273E1F6F|nr:molecular chaperone TorD [Oceanimonas sp. CHS3-5]MDP5291044.1 molecular chaperone TorD [Oceanimonas sp. CHS3-5]